MSSLQAGLAFLPMMIISGAVTPFSARIVERTAPRIPILTGLALMAIGGIGLALLDPSTPAHPKVQFVVSRRLCWASWRAALRSVSRRSVQSRWCRDKMRLEEAVSG